MRSRTIGILASTSMQSGTTTPSAVGCLKEWWHFFFLQCIVRKYDGVKPEGEHLPLEAGDSIRVLPWSRQLAGQHNQHPGLNVYAVKKNASRMVVANGSGGFSRAVPPSR